MTTVVNRHRMERPMGDGDVYIGRETKWGNPHRVVGSSPVARAAAIEAYRQDLAKNLQLQADATAELRGKVLWCSCKPLSCHGDILAAVADGDLSVLSDP